MDFLALLAHIDGDHIQHVDTLWLALTAGLAAGIAHTFMGADHLGALLPLSVNGKLRAAWLGVKWGVGHSMGVFIVAVLLLAGRETLDLGLVEAWGERLVGVMLVALGLWGVRRAFKQNLHVHAHEHDGQAHAHLHAHVQDAHEPGTWRAHLHSHAAVGAGTLHGLAGMAHLLGVLPALAAPRLAISMTYLVCFALGSIASMAAFAGGFGTLTSWLGSRSATLVKGTMYAAAVACIGIGIYWFAKTFVPEKPHSHSHARAAFDMPARGL